MNNVNLILIKKCVKIESVEYFDGYLKCKVRFVGFWDDILLDVFLWVEYELFVGVCFNDGDFSLC